MYSMLGCPEAQPVVQQVPHPVAVVRPDKIREPTE
jgi:hypothetical protein